MARVLSPTLTAAVSGTTRVPTLQVTIEDHILHYQSYQTPNTADAWNDACVANDGSIVRVRVTRGSGTSAQSVQWQRITNPDLASQWTVWTTLGGGAANCFQDGGCAISNNGGTLRIFAQQQVGGNALWVWSSSNSGLSWSASPSTVLSPPSSGVLLGISSAGNNDVFFLYQVLGLVIPGCSFFNGSSWSTLHSSPLGPLNYGGGIAAYWDGSVYWLVFSDSYTLYETSYNPLSNVWQPYPAIAPVTNTAIGRLAPRLFYDVNTGLYNLICIEADTGALTGAVYSYPRIRQSADLQHWSQGMLVHSIASTYGAVILPTASANLLISMSTILRATSYSQMNTQQYIDVSATVLSYSRKEQADQPSTLEVVLSNQPGNLATLLSQPDVTQPLGPQCSVLLHEGYQTGSGETLLVGTYRIASLQLERSPEKYQLRLLCTDILQQLTQINRFQMTYVSQSVAWLLREICARAGLFALSLPGSSQLTQTVPYFVLQAGRPYRVALDELCHIYDLHFFLDQSEVLQFRELSSADSVNWSYRPELELLTLGSGEQRGNHIIVSGKPVASSVQPILTTAEAYDDRHIQWIGQEQLLYHVDQKLLTPAQCASKAAFLLAQEQRARIRHQIQVPLNPAHQLFDVLSLTDVSAPLGSGQSSTARIVESVTVYAAQQAECTQTLYLEGV